MDEKYQDSLLHFSAPASRRQAREIALCALYALEVSDNSLEYVLNELNTDSQADDDIVHFTRDLIVRTFEHRDEADKYIRKRSTNWKFERIAIIDRIVMRMAISEFLNFHDIPPKVSIDEAIELSKQYSTEKSSSYINGVLDGVYEDLKADNKIIKSGRGRRDTPRRKRHQSPSANKKS